MGGGKITAPLSSLSLSHASEAEKSVGIPVNTEERETCIMSN